MTQRYSVSIFLRFRLLSPILDLLVTYKIHFIFILASNKPKIMKYVYNIYIKDIWDQWTYLYCNFILYCSFDSFKCCIDDTWFARVNYLVFSSLYNFHVPLHHFYIDCFVLNSEQYWNQKYSRRRTVSEM